MSSDEIVLSDHSEVRIKERMLLAPEEVLVRLQKEIYDEVKTIEKDGIVYKYVVIWDDIAQKPFLLIMGKETKAWTVISVYETFKDHFRKDNAIVRLSHIFISRRKYNRYLAKTEAKKQKQLLEDEMGKMVHLDIKVNLYSESERRQQVKTFKRIVSVPPEDYQARLQSNPLLLLNEALAKMSEYQVDYPAGVQFLIEVYHSRQTGRVVLYKGMF